MNTRYLLLILLAITANLMNSQDPFDDQGVMNITTVTNDDPNSCLVTLSLVLYGDHIDFFSTVISNSVPDCTHHDMQFVSFFKGDSLNSSIVLAPTANANISTGTLNLSTVQSMNGTACLYQGHFIDGMAYYGCYFLYNDLYFTVQFYVNPATGLINTSYYDLMDPIVGSNNATVTAGNITVWKRPDWSFPSYFGDIYNACDGSSNTITNMNSEFVVTGMDLKQYLTNLSYFNEYSASPLWIRQTNTTNYTYYYVPDPYWNPFNGTAVNYCSDTGRKWSDILPDASYCENGCDMTFDLVNLLAYPLQTNGFKTVPSRALRSEEPQN